MFSYIEFKEAKDTGNDAVEFFNQISKGLFQGLALSLFYEFIELCTFFMICKSGAHDLDVIEGYNQVRNYYVLVNQLSFPLTL
ncbi:hypothetical protein SASPL_122988 [Salvia splendens]|uniref:Uncharacterized protein n=1 Tax=Salvia splendens TaxID=180675 RepID=A0A8X8XJI1_SALSN|nr:hypothetical protein SASPL_122988 [Salvia splendens]